MAFTLQDLGNIGELIGGIGVVVTLIYLAIQIRHNTASVRTAAGMDTARQVAAWADRMVVHPELGRIYNLAAEDPESLEPEEASRFMLYMAEIFFIYEGQFQMYRQKHITDDMWLPKRDILLGYLKNPLIKTWWLNRVSPFSESFFSILKPSALIHRKYLLPIKVLRASTKKKLAQISLRNRSKENNNELGSNRSRG